jgi:small subunit ribosomal protein S8
MDNLANTFSTIQNGQTRKKKLVSLKFSKIIWNICTVLFVEGFIQGFIRKDQDILVYLKYFHDKPVIQKIKKISLQGRRVYTKKISTLKIFSNLRPKSTLELFSENSINISNSRYSHSHSNLITKGLGIKILSTSKGILCDRDARFFGVGGEILCEVF